MKIKLSEHFTYKKLLRFTLPSVIMMVVASVYSVVDGLFVSNFVGDLALSAVNIVFPLAMIVGSFGLMLGAGGSAIVAKTFGEGNHELANRYFSMLVYAIVIIGAVLSAACIVFMHPIVRLIGASDRIAEDCVLYGRILLAGSVVFMLQTAFQSFFIAAEKPHWGLAVSVAAGLTNVLFDFLFIAVLNMGIGGAALATVLGYCVGGLVPLVYFAANKRGLLRIGKTKLYVRQFFHACANGSSELLTNISASVVSILYNVQLMAMLQERGVAAYSVMMYVDFVFVAVFFGFSMGCAPVVSYHFGAKNRDELKSLFKKCMILVGTASAAMVIISELLSYPLAFAFVRYDKELLDLTVHGFRLFAVCYLFCGLNIFASAFFTALCNGLVSAIVSFSRSLILRGGCVLLMPFLFGVDGIWTAVIAAEGLAAIVSVSFLLANRRKYGYA